MYRDIPDDLKQLIEPVVLDHGYEIVDVEIVRGGGMGRLRITIDNPTGDGRVPVEGCAAVSREVGTLLDTTDAMPGRYQLEVSSPGLDRILGRERDFAAACGSEIKLMTRRPVDGRRRFRGRLVAFEGGVVRISVDGSETEIPFEDIEKANTVYEFTRADFTSGSGSGRGRGAKRSA